MNTTTHHACDLLPMSSSVSALVRQIVWKLDAALSFNGHPILSLQERAGLFDLAAASAILDRLAILPGMAAVETRARGRLLELFDMFNADPLEATVEQPRPVLAPLRLVPSPTLPQETPMIPNPTTRARGFTLIELMITVCIVGILAALAVPAYLAYVTRSQVSEGLGLVADLKVAIAEKYADTGRMPETLEEVPVQIASGRYVRGVTLEGGAILITYGGDDSNSYLRDDAHNVLALVPGATSSGVVVWQCGRAAKVEGEDTAWPGDAATLTTIEAKYLPAACRA